MNVLLKQTMQIGTINRNVSSDIIYRNMMCIILINEMQCIFGQSDPYQMLVGGVAGRYIYQDNQWKFEAGDFNTNESFDLRLQSIILRLKVSSS